MEDIINKLYDIDLNNRFFIEKKNFEELEITNITELLKLGIIAKINDNLYAFRYSKLEEYGNYYMNIEKYDLAIKCFLRCYFLKQNNKKIIDDFFNKMIELKDLNNILPCYYTYLDNKEIINNYDILILYALKYIVKLPNKYIELLSNINKKDIINNIKEKKLAKDIFDNNYISIINIQNDNNVYEKNLLKLISYIKMERKNKTKRLIELNDYETVNYILSGSKKDTEEEYILKIIDTINSIKNTQEIPKIKSLNKPINIYEAIDNNQFDEALNLAKEGSKLYILLKDLNDLINNISVNKKRISYDRLEKPKKLYYKITKKINLNSFDQEFYNLAFEYLDCFKSTKYMFIIEELVKISKLNEDTRFLRSFLYNKLNPKNPTIYIKPFVTSYQNNLEKGNYEIAKIYLEIIKKIIKVSNTKINIDKNLSHILKKNKK